MDIRPPASRVGLFCHEDRFYQQPFCHEKEEKIGELWMELVADVISPCRKAGNNVGRFFFFLVPFFVFCFAVCLSLPMTSFRKFIISTGLLTFVTSRAPCIGWIVHRRDSVPLRCGWPASTITTETNREGRALKLHP